MKLIFWISAGLILYAYVVYPLLLVLLASLRQVWDDLSFALTRRNRRQQANTSSVAPVSLVIAAHNEESVIVEKMRNCAELDYPPERLEILVGCDACSDGTPELARQAAAPNTRIFEFPQRSGKPAMLNRLVPEARGEIVVFSDANTMLDPAAVRLLVRHFRNPRVGCVCGELRLASPSGGPRSEGLYWRFETFLKFLESRLNLLLGANGAVFAIRRDLFVPLPPQGIIDDFLVAMRIRAQGYRLVYDPEAVGLEEAAGSLDHEFRRRVRIGAGNFHALRFTWRLLSPTAGPIAFSYWSHKICRWLVPFALPVAFAAALALAREPFYAASVAVGSAVVLLALLGHRLERQRVHRSICSVPYYFVSMNVALLLGFVRFLNGRQTAVWSRTVRPPLPKSAP